MIGKNFIFDFETLGTNLIKGFPVLDIAYVVFDAERFVSSEPYEFEELVDLMQYAKFDVADHCKTYGYKPEKSTIEWWSQQSKEAQRNIQPMSTDISIAKFADQLLEYLNNNKPKYWWSRGNTFDPLVLYRIFDDLNRSDELNKVCPHWAVRDIRTYIDAKFDFSGAVQNGFVLDEWKDKFVAHNAKHDVAADILRLQKIVRSIEVDEE